jgi:tetratricopeptide (TPR) repeat protein
LQTRLGDLDAARAALHRLEALPLPAENGPMVNEMVLSVRGWIAFEEGRFDDVMTILEDAAQYSLIAMSYSGLHDRPYQRYLRALTLEKLGRPAEAAPWFEYINEKTERTLGFVAPAHLQLGGIYEQTGDHAKALHHYRAFLKLYRDCDDRYQPLVEKARLRVAELED